MSSEQVRPKRGRKAPEPGPGPPDRPAEEVPERSSAPAGWPGMPGRSAEHDVGSGAEVTEAQRALER